MCAVSMVMDDWTKKTWPNILPGFQPWTNPPAIGIPAEDFKKLKEEVEKLKEELKKARQKDIQEKVPDCKMKESVELIKTLADILGVDLEDILDGHEKS